MGINRHFTTGNQAVILQLALSAQRKGIAGRDSAVIAHAHAVFSADKLNFIGVHAAKAGDVHRQRRFAEHGRRNTAGRQGGVIDVITAGDDAQILRLQLGVDLHRTGDNVGIACAAVIHSLTGDHHLAVVNIKAGQLAVAHFGGPGHQRGAAGVNKPAAVAGNA